MKLTGLQIFKYLPGGKKEKEANCKKCGFPTCMTFAMKLAKGEVSIDKCEFVSDELKALFEEASQLQQQETTFGSREKQVKVGNETVMFRHDKKFVNPTCFAIKLDSADSEFDQKLQKISSYEVERVGENFTVDAVALFDNDETFADKAMQVSQAGMPLILVGSDYDNMEKAVDMVKDSVPLVYLKADNAIDLQKKHGVPVVVSGSSVDNLADKASKLEDGKLVLNINNLPAKDMIQSLTYIRRMAIEQKFKPLGFPVITFLQDIKDISLDAIEQGIFASVLACKYSNIVVLDDFNEAILYALVTLRQNIFTDPEKPLQIEPKVYPIGEVDENSPVIVTTNFALTYFTVASEIESSNISSYLVVTPSDGMSVLTAWSADKFNGEIIAKAFKEYGISDLVNHRKLIIPGYVSVLKSEIEEEMPDWEVIVGANEAVDIVDFLKKYKEMCLA